MKITLIIILSLIGLIIGSIAIKILFFPVNTAQKLIDTAYDAQNKVLNADNAIYNYEWFKQTYQDIEAAKQQLNNATVTLNTFSEMAGDRINWTFEDKQEHSRLSAVQLGLQNYIEQLIATYNARASMATRNIFQNGVLPSYIDALTFIKK